MLNSFAIFCAKYLVFIEAGMAFIAVYAMLSNKPRQLRNRYLLTAVSTAALSLVLGLLASKLHSDPRPFVTDGVASLFPHAANNGFPSDHSLLAGALVAVVGMVELSLVPPFALLAALVGWGRVACHIHHTQDVLGSFAIVVVAWLFCVRLTRWLLLSVRHWQDSEVQEDEPEIGGRLSYASAAPMRRVRSTVDMPTESNLA